MKSLKNSSFNFTTLILAVRPGYTKNREEATQSLRTETTAELQVFLKNKKMPDTKAFGGTYKALTDGRRRC